MSTEITNYQPPQAALADYQTRAVQRLGDWVRSADAALWVTDLRPRGKDSRVGERESHRPDPGHTLPVW